MKSKNQLITKVNRAFQDVKLEDGISLWDAQGLEDYATAEECKNLRERDDKTDWRNIPPIAIYQCLSSLAFFDAKGMRFHLPQFLLFALEAIDNQNTIYEKGFEISDFIWDLEFHLTYASSLEFSKNENDQDQFDYNEKQFSLLNSAQKLVVLRFLEFVAEEYVNMNQNEVSENGDAETYNRIKKGIAYWQRKGVNVNANF